MPTLSEVRAQYPQYNSMSDDEFADKLYKKFYADKMGRAEFYNKMATKDVADGIKKDELKYRSTILPLGKTQEGNIVPAVPGIVKSAVEGVKSLAQLPQQLIQAGQAGAPGSREVTEAAIAPAAETAMAFTPTSAGAKVAKSLLRKPNILTTEEQHDAAKAVYKDVEQAGVQIKPEAFRRAVSDVVAGAKEAGFDRDIQKEAAGALRRLGEEAANKKAQTETRAITKMQDGKRVITGMENVTKEAAPTSLKDFDILRQVAQSAAKSNNSNDRRIGGLIKQAMDDFLADLKPSDVVGGDAPGTVAKLTRARELWSKYSKSSEIDRLFDNAALDAKDYSASGFENALRKQFKQMAKNQNRMRKYSPDERAAIRAVASGSKLQDALVKVGKFAPTSGFFASVLTGEIALRAAVRPELLLVPGFGAVAKFAATKLRQGQAEAARKMVAGGKEQASYVAQKSANRKQFIKNSAQKATAASAFAPTRITIPLDPNNI